MITVKRFSYNAFQVNTYVLSDETNECIIIDPGMDSEEEENELVAYLEDNKLKPVMLVNTHTHVDHILGNPFISEKYGLPLAAHKDSEQFLRGAKAHAMIFGIQLKEVKEIDEYLEEGAELTFGNSSLQILLTPGHADGSLCFYSAADEIVITGDVLFNQSIGRTDLPTGDYSKLQQSIWKKLFVLPDTTTAFPGHGPETTIGFEKANNPFVAIEP